MRHAAIGILLLTFSLVWAASAGAETYGSGVSVTETTAVSEILANPAAYQGRTVAVEGTVVEVCAKRGCWVELSSDQKYQTIRIKVTDGVIVFPMSARGKHARVQGTVEELQMSAEQALAAARHHAEEQGKAFDPSSVSGPTTHVRIRATGAEIR
ncbi:MAG: DUF4920 domain-containing protein [Deferrisomatales bacterium]|nr:DUF4920 domain-containing protein [Deferrisomatales bacterium]